MYRIVWEDFKRKNPNVSQAFEELTYHLFCRRFGIVEGVFGYKNQAGIETDPIKKKNSWIGFQTKFFEIDIAKDELISSIEKAKLKNNKLNKIIFYINKEFSESSKKGVKECKQKVDIEKCATSKGLDIEWVVLKNFEILLNQPKNFDLTQLYFGHGDEFGFIEGSSNPKILTFLQSPEYIHLPFLDSDLKVEKNISKRMLAINKKAFLLVGHPGSGKSYFMHHLLMEFGGLNQKNEQAMKEVIRRNASIPVLINLKDCIEETLENIIRNRTQDFGLNNNRLGFSYLLDGLDELDEGKADKVLSYISQLECQRSTKKVVLSCRSGNSNRIRTKVYLDVEEFSIGSLDESILTEYFRVRGNREKIAKLRTFKTQNPELTRKLNDILLIKLFWETIEVLQPENTIITDLMGQKIKLLLRDPAHKKGIDNLNILNPKEKFLIVLNEEISAKFSQRYQYRFPQKELQDLILNEYPRIDFKAVNLILDYLAQMFFDYTAPSPDHPDPSFIYQHRRYQEYFYVRKLKKLYEKDLTVLRQHQILLNSEFFLELFLPFLRKEYQTEADLPRLLQLSLIDVYMGHHKGWGAEESPISSDRFIITVANQSDRLFDSLVEDDAFDIYKTNLIDIKKLTELFKRWNKDKSDYDSTNQLRGIWEGGVRSLIQNAVIFWEGRKFAIAKKLLKNLDDVRQIYEKNNFLEKEQSKNELRDPYWERIRDWLYIRLIINKEKVDDLFTRIHSYAQKLSDQEYAASKETPKEKLIGTFFRICLSNGIDVFKIADKLDEFEYNLLLHTLISSDFIPIFVRKKAFQRSLKRKLKIYNKELNDKTYFIAFYKKYLNIALQAKEEEFLKQKIQKIRKERPIDWWVDRLEHTFAIASFALDEENFSKLLQDRDENSLRYNYYDELGLYASLFDKYIKFLNKETTLENIISDFNTYTARNTRVIHGRVLVSLSPKILPLAISNPEW